MSQHTAQVIWTLQGGDDFKSGKFSRAHVWKFDGGAMVPATAAPSVVPPPMSDETAVDPEEAFVAALSSCHMLFFLYFALRAGFTVTGYTDNAVGHLEKVDGKTTMARVELRPSITYDGAAPSPEDLDKLHHDAHEACFIANSVTTKIAILEPEAAV